MTGISEILVLILLISGILILPRMFKPAPAAKSKKTAAKSLSMKLRAGIAISVLYPAVSALVLKPWQGNIVLYLSAGLLPVALAWALIWVLAAKKH
ncbi:MAG: hypothetical protein HUN04_03240 [Desulfobacter sp.]|nr:MAG: hypothetical protein HUN04_03240 [Desulfobacter sp.]